MNHVEHFELLTQGLDDAGLRVTDEQCEKMLAFLALLAKWNKTYNLTAVTDPREMISYHLLDSLSLAPFLGEGSLLDVGSGGGLPGIPLAILLPNKKICLLESKQKKINFLQHVVTSLQLTNVTVVRARVEDYQPGESFDEITCRAFSSLFDFLQMCGRLCRKDGVLIAMKGTRAQVETEAVPSSHCIEAIRPVVVPGLEMERHLVFCRAK